ncbi:hypothetical protein Cgig2_019229 [Carnegiea gigantea]|uniref:Uncharacterized protein n=1 Tax=Carnegiea gigantea TaxID=171969 RepID=A0A9Q1Q8U3_9CARY|nr:hypothetical protein Cgig2_019229 [Carnegiea gigantea]
MDAANSARLLPNFDYVPTMAASLPTSTSPSDEVREAARPDRNDRSRGENRDRSIRVDAPQSRYSSQGRPVKSTTASTLYATHSRRAPNAEEAIADELGTETTQCMKRGPQFLQKERAPVRPEPLEEECSIEYWPPLLVDTRRASLGPPGKLNFEEHNRPRIKKKEEQEASKDPYTSSVRILIIIIILVRCSLNMFIVRVRSLAIQRRGLLIAWTVFVSYRRIEIHQLRVLTLGPGFTTILNILDIRLEVALLAESIRGQGLKNSRKNSVRSLFPRW